MSPFRRIAAGVTLAVVATLATAIPASAHDQLISSTPAEGEQLASAPENVSMRFSGELIVLDSSMSGAVVMVVDESGRDWTTGELEVETDTVTAQLSPGMPVAGYQVRWQVVSADGHPIAGVIAFTIGDAEPMVTGGADVSTTDEDTSVPEDQIAGESSGPLRVLLIGASGAAIAGAVFALYRFLRRPQATAAPPESGESAAENH